MRNSFLFSLRVSILQYLLQERQIPTFNVAVLCVSLSLRGKESIFMR